MDFIIYIIIILLQIQTNISTSTYTCTKFYNAPIKISFPDIEQILSYIQSQEFSFELLETKAITEEEDIRDSIEYQNASLSEDVKMPLKQLMEKYGYNVEEHEVITEDGYILTMFRIPGKGKPIYLQHGFLTNAGDWVTAGLENAHSYFLASKGYDVWLGNFRGNRYSIRHVVYSTECAEFWDYSFHEMGLYDMGAMIDYILETTGRKKLILMGHSQGGTSGYVLLSERPEYNDKVELFVDFAPTAWMSHLKSPLPRLFSLLLNTGLSYKILHFAGIHSITIDSPIVNVFAPILCGETRLAKIVCSNVVFLLFGFDRGETDIKQLPIIINHVYPTAVSDKQLAHYVQNILTPYFRQFDYGELTNIEVYGTATPPDYDLSKVTAPVVLIYAGNDWFSNITDVEKLRNALPNVVDSYFIKDFNHGDHVYSKNLKTLVHPYISSLLEKY